MKNRLTIFSATGIVGGLTVFSFTTALAIEPPPDESKPPAALLGDTMEAPGINTPPKARESAAFLGVATAEVPGIVSDHLGIDAGTGVIISTVSPGSPAEKAGLSVNDIITAVDGNVITGPDHFSMTIGGSKVGDRIAMDLIHKGKPAKVEVTLIERPTEKDSGVMKQPFLDGLPKAQADRLRGLLEENLRYFGDDNFEGMMQPGFENNFREMRDQLWRGLDNESGDTSGFSQNSTIRLMDQEGSVEIKSSDGSTSVTVRDTDNTIVWEGPWDSDEDKAAAPEGIRERIDRVGAGKGFNFRFGTLGD